MWISTGTATPQHNLRTIQLPSIRHYITALLYLCFVFSQFCYSITLPLFCFQSLLLQHYLTSVLFSITSVTALPHLCFVVNHFCCSIASPLFCFQSVLLQHYLTSVLLSVSSVPTSYMYTGPARQAVCWFVWLWLEGPLPALALCPKDSTTSTLTTNPRQGWVCLTVLSCLLVTLSVSPVEIKVHRRYRH